MCKWLLIFIFFIYFSVCGAEVLSVLQFSPWCSTTGLGKSKIGL